MEQRKQKIIDKKFQLKTTFSVLAVMFIITFVFVATIGVNVVNDNRKIQKILNEQKDIIEAQGKINNLMLENLKDNKLIANAQVKQVSDKNTALMKKNTLLLHELTYRNNNILLIMIVFLIAAGIILYPVIIRRTHRISGPIFIMSEYIREIINGQYPDLRPMRKKDELKEFYALFSQLIEFLKKKDLHKEKITKTK